MNRFVQLFSWAVWGGFLLIVFVSLPGIFNPRAVADLLGVRSPVEPIWLAFAFLLLFITSWFHAAAALSPLERQLTAGTVVVAHFAVGLFFLCVYPKYQPGPVSWFGLAELVVGAILLVLFVGTIRDSTRLET